MKLSLMLVACSSLIALGRAYAPPVPLSVAAAEAEGAAFPRSPVPDSARATLIGAYPGSAERKCGRAPAAGRGWRAGDFALGGSIEDLRAGRPAKLWWAPLHAPPRTGGVLQLRTARLGTTAEAPDTLRQHRTDVALTVETRPAAFFPGTLQLPRPGEWLVVATSGTDWGCVILSVK